MKFVEDDDADAVEGRVVLQHANQNAVRDDLDARIGPDTRVEAHAVTDDPAHLVAKQRGHTPRRSPRREPSRLQHDNALPGQPLGAEESKRNARRLSDSRWGLQHQVKVMAQRIDDLLYLTSEGRLVTRRHALTTAVACVRKGRYSMSR